jgi:hypothetical protein
MFFQSLLPTSHPAFGSAPTVAEPDFEPLLDWLASADFDDLSESTAAGAIRALRRRGESAAASLAVLLRRALVSATPDWLAVHRPLRVLHGMGPAARPALPELVAALETDPPVNALLAARVIGQIGPAAQSARPALRRAAERWRDRGGVPKSITDALAEID